MEKLSLISKVLEIVRDMGSITSLVIVTGQPNECRRRHAFGHQAQSCPHFSQRAEVPDTTEGTIVMDRNLRSETPK